MCLNCPKGPDGDCGNSGKPMAILASDLMGTIGCNGDLAYRTTEDMQFFKNITNGCILVMGRVTYESLPNKKLKNREIVILSGRKNYKGDNGERVIHSMSALKHFVRKSGKQVFICGGRELYETFIPECDTVYLTLYNNNDELYSLKNKLTVISNDTFSEILNRKITKIQTIVNKDARGTILKCTKE